MAFMWDRANRRASGALWLIAVFAFSLLGGCQHELSGKYMGNFNDGICWLQLVRTPDNHLTGQIETSELKPDGKIERNAVCPLNCGKWQRLHDLGDHFWNSGSNIVGHSRRQQSNAYGFSAYPVDTRTLGSRISATTRPVNDEIEKRSRRLLSPLRPARGRRIHTRLSSVKSRELQNRMQELDSDADLHLGRFPAAESRYIAITARMTDLLKRERQLTGNSNTSVARAQLVVAMNQASIETDQLHNSAQSLKFPASECRACRYAGNSARPDLSRKFSR